MVWKKLTIICWTDVSRPAGPAAFALYSYFEKGCRKKCAPTIPKGNVGYDQYTVSDDCSYRTYFGCFPLAIANITSQITRAILSNFFEERCIQNHPQCLLGLSRALFPTTFLDITVYCNVFLICIYFITYVHICLFVYLSISLSYSVGPFMSGLRLFLWQLGQERSLHQQARVHVWILSLDMRTMLQFIK